MALSRKWYSHPLVLSNYTRCLFRHTLCQGYRTRVIGAREYDGGSPE